jgi:hypothetical protein
MASKRDLRVGTRVRFSFLARGSRPVEGEIVGRGESAITGEKEYAVKVPGFDQVIWAEAGRLTVVRGRRHRSVRRE